MISDLFSKQGAPHKGSLAAPACQCSVQTSTFWEWDYRHASTIQVRSKTKLFQVQTNRETFDLLGVTCAWVSENVGDKCICNAETLSMDTVGASRVEWQQIVWISNKELLQGQQLMSRHPVVWFRLWFEKSVLHVVGRTNDAREVSPTLFICRISAFARQLKTIK